MARKFYRKRSARTSRRQLSTKRIYSRTSARAQASQIASLRNRVNRVYRACKPEIKSSYASPETISYTSSSLSSYYRIYPLTTPSQGVGDNQRIGNKIKVLNGTVYLSMEYFNNSSTGYHNSESSGAQYRVIIGQFRTPQGSNIIPTIGTLFDNPSFSGATYTQMAVCPLKTGITSMYAIIKDILRYKHQGLV